LIDGAWLVQALVYGLKVAEAVEEEEIKGDSAGNGGCQQGQTAVRVAVKDLSQSEAGQVAQEVVVVATVQDTLIERSSPKELDQCLHLS